MLYIKRQKDQRDAERHDAVGWAWAFIHFFIHHSTRVSKTPAVYQDVGWGGNKQAQRQTRSFTTSCLFVYFSAKDCAEC